MGVCVIPPTRKSHCSGPVRSVLAAPAPAAAPTTTKTKKSPYSFAGGRVEHLPGIRTFVLTLPDGRVLERGIGLGGVYDPPKFWIQSSPESPEHGRMRSRRLPDPGAVPEGVRGPICMQKKEIIWSPYYWQGFNHL